MFSVHSFLCKYGVRMVVAGIWVYFIIDIMCISCESFIQFIKVLIIGLETTH